MRRREFIGIIGGAAAWPVGLHAQTQRARKVRIGILMGYLETDPTAQQWLGALKQELGLRGWHEERNVDIDLRWAGADPNKAAVFARELVSHSPHLIVANTTPVCQAVHNETKTIPIVFIIVSDPIGSGLVKSFSQPGGNVTGFVNFETSLVEKWLELLKEIAPRVSEVAVMFNSKTAPYAERYFEFSRSGAVRLGMKPFKAVVTSESDIRSAIEQLAATRDSGLLLITDGFLLVNRRIIIEQTAIYKIPCVYFFRAAIEEGGLVSYGVDTQDLFRRTGEYADRILRGQKPMDLPVQLPTKFDLAVNTKTAKSLGLTVPASLLARADKVIE